MSQQDLFGAPITSPSPPPEAPSDIPDEQILCRPIQHRLDKTYRMVSDGHLLDAHIECKVIAGETTSGVIRDRCERMAEALWDARLIVDAWRVIERKRRTA